jgi:uncharacterized phage infection (PIP) family protein YhgE
MQRLSGAIDRIKTSADETAKIVKTIDEMAFQTNLLALNAAVEAARARDAGRGFAVVAEDVRNLAIRSAEAAKNTAQMIEESVQNADEGVALNHEVLQNLEEITTQVDKVSRVMGEITAASEQQTEGVEQINKAVEQMNQVIQQNARQLRRGLQYGRGTGGPGDDAAEPGGDFHLTNASGSLAQGGNQQTVQDPSTAAPSPQRPAPALAVAEASHGHSGEVVFPVDPEQILPLRDDDDAVALKDF